MSGAHLISGGGCPQRHGDARYLLTPSLQQQHIWKSVEDGKKSRPDRRRLDRVRIKYAAGLLMSSLAALGQCWGINSCGQRGWIKRSSPEDHHITAACVEYLSHPTAINTGMEFRCYKPAVTASALPAPEALPLQGRCIPSRKTGSRIQLPPHYARCGSC